MYLFEQVVDQMEQKLYALEDQNQDLLSYYRKAIAISSQSLLDLKAIKQLGKFNTPEKEIIFFKKLKPAIISRLIYFTNLYNIEISKPITSSSKIIKYYKKKIEKYQKYIDDNIEFYKYIKTGNKKLDQLYFMHSKLDLKYYPEMYNYYSDPDFNTTHDTLLATLLAYEKLLTDLKAEIHSLKRKSTNNTGTVLDMKLEWKANKIDLVELIYALHSSGALGENQIKLKDLATACELIFNIKLNDYSRKFLEIRSRTSGHTKFLDRLKDALEDKMKQFDEYKTLTIQSNDSRSRLIESYLKKSDKKNRKL